MKLMMLLTLSIFFMACAPENDPTAKYNTEELVPLDKKNFHVQNYLPQDAIKMSIEYKTPRVWKKSEENQILLNLNYNLVGLSDPTLTIKIGQQESLPEWLKFELVSESANKKTYVLKGNPSLRESSESNVATYEVELKLAYNVEKSDSNALKMLKFYKSQTSQRLNIEIGKM